MLRACGHVGSPRSGDRSPSSSPLSACCLLTCKRDAQVALLRSTLSAPATVCGGFVAMANLGDRILWGMSFQNCLKVVREEGQRAGGRQLSSPSSLLLFPLPDLVRTHSAASRFLLARLPGPLWRSGLVLPPSLSLQGRPVQCCFATSGAGHILPRTRVQRSGGIRRIAANHGGRCYPWACPLLLPMAVVLHCEWVCRTLTCATVCT